MLSTFISSSAGYTGFAKSLYDHDRFDSGTEKSVAVILDDADEIDVWVRLQHGWLVEPKADRDLQTDAVLGKELAAKRWANYVSSQTGVEWAYLLVGETGVAEARGSWAALKKLGR